MHRAIEPRQLHALRELGAEIKSRRPAPVYAQASASEEGAFFFVERGEITPPTVQSTLGMRALLLADDQGMRPLWQLECHAANHLYTERGKTSVVHKYVFRWDDDAVHQAERKVLVRDESVANYTPPSLETRAEHRLMGLSDLAIAWVAIEDDFNRVTAADYDDLFKMSASYLLAKSD